MILSPSCVETMQETIRTIILPLVVCLQHLWNISVSGFVLLCKFSFFHCLFLFLNNFIFCLFALLFLFLILYFFVCFCLCVGGMKWLAELRSGKTARSLLFRPLKSSNNFCSYFSAKNLLTTFIRTFLLNTQFGFFSDIIKWEIMLNLENSSR